MLKDLFCYIILVATRETQEGATRVEKRFRFIDDYLVFLDCEHLECESGFTPTLCNSKDCSAHLKLAHELTVDNFITFLNPGLHLSAAGMYVGTLSPD